LYEVFEPYITHICTQHVLFEKAPFARYHRLPEDPRLLRFQSLSI